VRQHGQRSRDRDRDAAHQGDDERGAPQSVPVRTVVKYAGRVEGADRVDEVLREAFRCATTGRPGPVYVEVPQDVVLETREFPPLVPAEEYRQPPQGAAEEEVEAAADMLQNASMPMIVAGAGIQTCRAHAELARLAEVLQCPVATTFGGRGTLPNTHPQQITLLGPIGGVVANAADCVLAIGSSLGEMFSFGGPPLFAGPELQSWIQIERDPSAIGVNRKVDVALVGDLRRVIPQLGAALEKRGPFQPSPELARWREEQQALLRELWDGAPDTTPMHPGRAIVEARRVIPDDAVLVVDGGSTALFDAYYNEQRSIDFLGTHNFGHLGAGFPYAIAAKLAVGPDRPVCLVTGDGAFGFYMAELETAVRHDLAVVVLVNYDQHWGMEHAGQLADFGELIECRTAPIRLDRIAEGFGAHGEYVTTTAEVGPAVQRADTLAPGSPLLRTRGDFSPRLGEC